MDSVSQKDYTRHKNREESIWDQLLCVDNSGGRVWVPRARHSILGDFLSAEQQLKILGKLLDLI